MDIKQILEKALSEMKDETGKVTVTLLYKFADKVVKETDTGIDDMILPMVYTILEKEGLIDKRLM